MDGWHQPGTLIAQQYRGDERANDAFLRLLLLFFVCKQRKQISERSVSAASYSHVRLSIKCKSYVDFVFVYSAAANANNGEKEYQLLCKYIHTSGDTMLPTVYPLSSAMWNKAQDGVYMTATISRERWSNTMLTSVATHLEQNVIHSTRSAGKGHIQAVTDSNVFVRVCVSKWTHLTFYHMVVLHHTQTWWRLQDIDHKQEVLFRRRSTNWGGNIRYR